MTQNPRNTKSKKDKGKGKEKEKEKKGKTPDSDDSSEEQGKGKDGFWAKKKRGVASSGLGKALIEQHLDKESRTLIKTLCEMIAVTHDKKTAETVKKDIFKVAAKTLLLYQDGKVSNDQFQSLRVHFRRICSAVRNGYLVTKSLTPDTADRIASVVSTFGTGVRSIVKPFLSETTIERIDFLLSIFTSAEFLLSASKEKSFDSVAMSVGKRGRYNHNNDIQRSRPQTDFGQTQAYTKPHEFHGPLPETINEPLLLTDEQIRSFLLNGYLPSTLPSSFHKYIIQSMKDLPNSDKLGNNCLSGVPALNQVYSDPTIKGALISLLGPNYGMQPHRAVHLSPPGKSPQQWHRDTFWGYPRPWMVMGMYYPQATTVQMGATGAKPGTQYYSIDPKRYNGPFTNHFKDDDDRSDTQFVCPEGSVAFIHYDLIHKGTANRSQFHRYMFKFQFYRTEAPSQPSWNCKEPKWIPFVEPSSRKKAIEPICQAIWEWMCGSESSFNRSNISEADVKSLIEQLSSPNEWTRFYAAFKLCLGGKHDILFKQLLHTDEQLRFVAAHALALMPKPPSECATTLVEWIESKPNHTKFLCLYILGEWGKFTELLEKLDKVAALTDDQTIMYLVQTLGRLGNHVSEAAVVTLGQIMTRHGSDQVRMMASMALDLLATTQPHTLEVVLEPLKQGLSNYNRYIQAYCLSALSKMKSVTAKEIALTHLMASRWCPITNAENTF